FLPPSFFPHPSTTHIYTLSLHDALPIYPDLEVVIKHGGELVRIVDNKSGQKWDLDAVKYTLSMAEMPDGLKIELPGKEPFVSPRSEEHTSELQSQSNLVCRLLLEKKKQK